MSIKENICEVIENIKKYSSHPEKVKLIAVTKYVDENVIEKILDTGHNILGENKAQVIREKIDYFKAKNMDIEWHFIGNLQKNKVKYIINDVSLIHSVNKLSLAEEINKRAEQVGKVIDILLEINIYGEESKQGYKLEELISDLEALKNLKNINIKGLMTMGPLDVDEVTTRKVFAELVRIKKELNENYFNNSLTELSMGMSGDYKIALQEGSTIIRVGSKLYEGIL
ncbi:YggS family pyridoxal phosphate-dependent enzyme [Fusobacterium gastrosuis]|uniref:YggS family pyridoxal phosphate-dependent enzyme n=1 Tax=Fusobacterium gastrosuis TaxID=1755100 RepID=UPI0029755872|nr:YggS family pyridoxal phosphate-dependent enzyme [Fusobacteriaceae bacterium]MDY5713367.1 YggS family pyridoxal phosphate-dependent enzyme [Fusobacterium gastrosuis]